MTLPAPNLDDRTFQDIVDEAKRLIPRYCPDWTDHNVADPGVALIELLAWMSEAVIYRLNQVPDRLYLKFLELLGIQPYPASPARAELLFTLSGPPAEPVRVPACTQVATDDRGEDDPVVFTTDTDLVLRQPALSACLTRCADGTLDDVWDGLRTRTGRATCFPTLQPGDALYLGFAEPVGGNLLRIDVETSAEGAGIRPEDPPRVWQSWDGTRWRPVRVLSDSSDGFNSTGSVTLLLPPVHQPMPVGPTRAHWLRCRLVAPTGGQLPYDRSPQLDAIAVECLGGAVSAHHCEPAGAELLGVSTGEPGQVFGVRRAPVLPRRPDEVVRLVVPGSAAAGDPGVPAGSAPGGRDWSEVADFTDTCAGDEVYVWSSATGEITFAPQVRRPQTVPGAAASHPERDVPAGFRRFGAVPPAGCQVWVTGYRYGGGRRGNVGARTLTALRTSIPSVSAVTNLDPATGGVDPETIENVRLRGPLELRGGNRAVTAVDFERLTLQAARGVARACCLPPQTPADPVRVLVVPRVDVPPESLELADLDLPEDLQRTIADHLEERRLLTMRVTVGKPAYLGISVAARVRAAAGMRPETVRAACESALYRYLNPVSGGPHGQGWPFRRDLNIGEIFAVLGGVPGVGGVEDVVFFPADLTRRPGNRVLDTRAGNVVRLPPGALLLSCEHRVLVIT
ncbi:MAG TPA: putative baseplate assembly protein [Kineosporiaceae bacterium]|nr:putative baseplate assembly protein [Kineosporiaceae bacterium]